jgi:4'-phosphopantetheinyl transferase
MKVVLSYKVYSTDFNSLIEKLSDTIPPSWKIQREQFISSSFFYKKIMARLMLLDLINKHFGSFEKICAGFNDGKPIYEGLSLNISYSGNLVIAGASPDGIIGIDMEKIKPIDFAAYQLEYTNDEWQQIATSIHELEAFYTIWTRKESVLKADGRGLSQLLSSFSVTDETVKLPNSTHSWHLNSFRFLESYLVSVASSEKKICIQMNPFLI